MAMGCERDGPMARCHHMQMAMDDDAMNPKRAGDAMKETAMDDDSR